MQHLAVGLHKLRNARLERLISGAQKYTFEGVTWTLYTYTDPSSRAIQGT